MTTLNPTLFFFYLLDLKPVLYELQEDQIQGGQKHNALTFAPSTKYKKSGTKYVFCWMLLLVFYFNLLFLVS